MQFFYRFLHDNKSMSGMLVAGIRSDVKMETGQWKQPFSNLLADKLHP